jgi:hypothetical protein
VDGIGRKIALLREAFRQADNAIPEILERRGAAAPALVG